MNEKNNYCEITKQVKKNKGRGKGEPIVYEDGLLNGTVLMY